MKRSIACINRCVFIVTVLLALTACSSSEEEPLSPAATYEQGALGVEELGVDTYRPLQLTNAVAFGDYLASKGLDVYQFQTLLGGALNTMMTRRVYDLDSLFYVQHGSPRLVFRHWHVESYAFSYLSRSVTGEVVRLSGRVTLPIYLDGQHEVSSLSLCINQHLTNQPAAPSAALTPMAMRAMFNSAVIEPDLEGFGVSADRTPCPIAYDVMARQTLDCVRAALEVMKRHRATLAANGHTTLWAASTGAPIAAAFARLYEESLTTAEKNTMRLQGVYCAEGPFNLNDIAYYMSQNAAADACMARHIAYYLNALPASKLHGHEPREFLPEWMQVYQVDVNGTPYSYYDALVQQKMPADQLFRLWPDAYPKEQLRYNLAYDMTLDDGTLDFDNDKVKVMLDVLVGFGNWGLWDPITDIYVVHNTDDNCVPYMQARDFYEARRASQHVFWKPITTPQITIADNTHEATILHAISDMVIFEEPAEAFDNN